MCDLIWPQLEDWIAVPGSSVSGRQRKVMNPETGEPSTSR